MPATIKVVKVEASQFCETKRWHKQEMIPTTMGMKNENIDV